MMPYFPPRIDQAKKKGEEEEEGKDGGEWGLEEREDGEACCVENDASEIELQIATPSPFLHSKGALKGN